MWCDVQAGFQKRAHAAASLGFIPTNRQPLTANRFEVRHER